jgi:O-antigen ligase
MTAWRTGVPRIVAVLAAFVAAGMVLGLAGASGAPRAALYALVAYLGAFGALLLGWQEGSLPLVRWTLVRVLTVAAPLLALYALYQYFVGMPRWDQQWLATVDFSSIGAPEAGKIRSFASLNSPGLLGLVLALTMVLYIGREGLVRWTSIALIVTVGGLSVTYVRSAWVALAAAAIVLVLVSGRQAARRVGRVGVLMVMAVLALSATGSTYTAVVGRIATFGSLNSDQSARARTATPLQLLPELTSRPFGYGLGSAGEATRLSLTSGLKAPDNGYLAMAYQLGFAGALLVVGALLTAIALAMRRLLLRRDPDRALLAALFTFFLVALAGADGFYGFAGVTLWYVTGAALGRSAAPRDVPSTLSTT